MAAAVLIFALTLPWRSDPSSPVETPGLRNETPGITSLIPETEPLDRRAATLRWTAGPEGTRYRVTVSTEDFRVLATRDALTVNELTLDPDALSSLRSGDKVLWRVEAIEPAGRRRSSPTFVHRLR